MVSWGNGFRASRSVSRSVGFLATGVVAELRTGLHRT